jgi:small multidrug resistance pump
MASFSIPVLAGFAATVMGQIGALALLPLTRGFTALGPTIACIALFVVSLGISARLVNSGVELSSLTPIATVAIQLFILFIGIAVYGEPASPIRIALLFAAALMIGVATRL